jgi:uncharacterized membrane protein (DUF2068 family)
VGKSNRVIAAIGVFKLLKAAILVTLGVAGLAKEPSELAHRIRHLASGIGISPGDRALAHLVGKLSSFDDHKARELAIGSLCYAAVFLVEGIGLLSHKRWAEWLTVVVTASFIPIEIYEAVQHFSAGKIVALILNVAILGYLLWRRISESRSIKGRLGYVLGHMQ